MTADDCPFCARIAAGQYDGEEDGVVWFEPLNPVGPGHLLFVPVEHALSAVSDPVVAGRVTTVACRALHGQGDGNLIWNVGPAAGKTIDHAHLHWVPRRPGDRLKMPWTGQHSRWRRARRTLADLAVTVGVHLGVIRLPDR